MKRWILLSTLGLLVLLCVSALVIWSGAHYLSRDLPPVDSIRQLQLSVPLRVLREDGKLIGQFGAERRSLLRSDDIPPTVITQFSAAAHPRFFTHPLIALHGLVLPSFVIALFAAHTKGGPPKTLHL